MSGKKVLDFVITSYEEAVRRRGPMGNWKRVTFLTFLFVVLFGSGTLYLVARYWPQLANRPDRQPQISRAMSMAQDLAFQKDDRINEIVDKSLMAMGGARRFDDLKDMVQKGCNRVESPAGEITGTRVLYTTSSPRMFRLEQKILGRKTITGFDGRKVWVEQDGQQLFVPPAVMEAVKIEMERNQFLVDYKKGVYNTKYLGTHKLSDKRNVHMILFEGSRGGQTTILIDSETYYVNSWEFREPNQGKNIRVRLNDYRQVDVYAFPFQITTYQDGEKMEEITIEEINVNSGLEASLFEPQAPPERP